METPTSTFTTEQVIESAKSTLRLSAPKAEIDRLVQSAAEIAVIDYNDSEGIKAADAKRKELKAVRTAIERKRKELKEVATKYGKAVDDTAKELASPIDAAETRIEKMLEDLERKKKADAEKAERERVEMFNARTRQLSEIGAKFDGQFWALGKKKIAPDRISAYMQDEWETVVIHHFMQERERLQEEERRAKEEAEKVAEVLAEAQRIAEENARLRAELERLKNPPAMEMPTAKMPISEPVPIFEPATQKMPAYIAEQEGIKDRTAGIAEPTEASEPIAEPETETANEPGISASEAHLIGLIKANSGQEANHFRGGYRQGVRFTKEAVIAILKDLTIQKRSDLIAKIENI